MFNYETVIADKISYWERQPTDRAGTLNSFDGTFAFTDFELIPEVFVEYLMERFANKYEKIKLEDVNAAINEVWDGPGSVANIVYETWQMRLARKPKPEEDKA